MAVALRARAPPHRATRRGMGGARGGAGGGGLVDKRWLVRRLLPSRSDVGGRVFLFLCQAQASS